jgi:phosphoglycerate dehydrogenase-like enzyme
MVVRTRAAPPDADADADRRHIDEYGAGVDDLYRLLPFADIVVLTCTQNEATRGIVGHEFLRRCKPGVRIINVARGGLLDYEAVRKVGPRPAWL